MLDIVLEGGLIVDGTGKPAFVTDVAVAGDRIARLGNCADLDAVQRVPCGGLIVAPGFIDMHSHSDEILLVLPTADSKIRQGVTTEVGGNCGFSPAPLNDAMLADKSNDLRERYCYEDVRWKDFDGFFGALERSPAALNFCCLAGLGTVRNAVEGTLPQPLDADQLAPGATAGARVVRARCDRDLVGTHLSARALCGFERARQPSALGGCCRERFVCVAHPQRGGWLASRRR